VFGKGGGEVVVDSGLKTHHDEIQFLVDRFSQAQRHRIPLQISLSQYNMTLTACETRVYRAHRRDVGVSDIVTGNTTVSAINLLQDLNDEQALHLFSSSFQVTPYVSLDTVTGIYNTVNLV
jgi:hypothetical protein